jgi:hypothetical protein
MLFPALTGFGLALFVTLKSACAAEDTGMVTVAELLAAFVSRVVVATFTVSVMIVPPAVPAVTRYTAVTVAVEFGGTLALLQATGALFGQAHVAPPKLATATDTKLELLGVASLSVPVLQLLGPELVMTCV